MIINVLHNVVENVDKGIMIDAEYKNSSGSWVADKEISAIANYNIVKDYSIYAAYMPTCSTLPSSPIHWKIKYFFREGCFFREDVF